MRKFMNKSDIDRTLRINKNLAAVDLFSTPNLVQLHSIITEWGTIVKIALPTHLLIVKIFPLFFSQHNDVFNAVEER